MVIKIKSEDELLALCTELLHVTSNMRKFQKLWEHNYGVELRQRKKYYEELADALLEKLNVTEHREAKQIKIEIE